MNTKRLLTKPLWQKAVGVTKKPRRLFLKANLDGYFTCPVTSCDSECFKTQRGCRKHVFNKHGWYYFFEVKPDQNTYFPEINTRLNKEKLRKRSSTSSMLSFKKTCTVGVLFSKWLQSPGGGGKGLVQCNQILCKVLKFAKFCCEDVETSWDIPEAVLDYCIGSVTLISEFVEYIQNKWSVGHSGSIGYMNALSHMLDYRRSQAIRNDNISVFVSSEIYLDRVKKCLSKKMKSEWSIVLSIEYLSSINCWATLEDLQQVIPFHANKFTQIILNVGNTETFVPRNDLSFATSFIVAVLFLLVKASRPMTYQYLTVEMIESLKESGGVIDQTKFKTNYKYGFDSLVFSSQSTDILNGYIKCIRPRLNPICNYVLVTRNGNQLSQLSHIFGRVVYLAIGKYINPTRYRQIIETESVSRLDGAEQNILSRDQKHTSHVARVHYQKLESREVAMKGNICMNKLVDRENSELTLKRVNEAVTTSSCIGNENHRHARKKNVDFETGAVEQINRSKKVAFSCMEDDFLRIGIKKYGVGKWTQILRDDSHKFHPSRKASTLLLRARKLQIS